MSSKTRPERQFLLTLMLTSALVGSPACSTLTRADLAKREDYLASMSLHAFGDTDGARRRFPDKESGGFLTSAEQAWLATLAGRPEPEPLVPIGRDLESRKTLSASREAKAYFYKETEEGYFPAEHEAVAFHLISGFSFAAAGRPAEAMVEARRAAFYLQNQFGEEPGFDDPALRLWLAALWSYAGAWDSARVDLRVAAALDRSLHEAARLSELATPPRTLALVLVGPGPDLVWSPGLEGAALDQIRFVPGAASQPLKLGSSGLPPATPTLAWYSRHQERDRTIRQILATSRYMVEGIAPATAAGATMSIGTVAGVTVMALGIAAGGGIAYLTVKSVLTTSGQVLELLIGGLGLSGAVASAGVWAGVKTIKRSKDLSADILEGGLSPVEGYRYMRFLPDGILLTAVEQEPSVPTIETTDGQSYGPRLTLSAPRGGTRLLVYYVPGARGDMARASIAASWPLRKLQQRWVMLGNASGATAARDGCHALAAVDGNRLRYELPTWTQYLDARREGLLDPERNPRFAQRLTPDSEIWSAGETDGPCRVIALRDHGEGTVRDCQTPRHTLCIAKDAGGM